MWYIKTEIGDGAILNLIDCDKLRMHISIPGATVKKY